jgi:hypothetical protein
MMLDNIATLCLFAFVVFMVMAALPMLTRMRNSQGTPNQGANPFGGSERRLPRIPRDRRGPLTPEYDDPDVEGYGSFGRDRPDRGERKAPRPSPDKAPDRRPPSKSPSAGGSKSAPQASPRKRPMEPPSKDRPDDDRIKGSGSFGPSKS